MTALFTAEDEMAANYGDDLMSIVEFCKRNKIGRSTYYALQEAGLGPIALKIGRSVRITRLAEKDWRRRMERGDAEDFNSAEWGKTGDRAIVSW